MPRNEIVETVFKELEIHGLKPVLLSGGKHDKIKWNAHGRERCFIASVSPSDVRSRLNARAEVRRMLRDDGITIPEKPLKPSLLSQAMSVPPPMDPIGVRVARLEAEVNVLTEMFLEHFTRARQEPVIEMVVKGAEVRLRPEAETLNRWEPTKSLPIHAPTRKKGAVEQAILNAMSFHEISTAPELARVVGRVASHINTTLYNLQKKGLVEKLGRGEWRKAPKP